MSDPVGEGVNIRFVHVVKDHQSGQSAEAVATMRFVARLAAKTAFVRLEMEGRRKRKILREGGNEGR